MTRVLVSWISTVSVAALILQHTGVMYHASQWSPDGRWILASGTVDGTHIWIMTADGTDQRCLTCP